jgi:xylulokinase
MPEIVITLDIGGSGVKASCFDAAEDVATMAVQVHYPSIAVPEEGTFDPDAWAETAIAALAQLVARCPAQPLHYLGITVSAIRIPFVLLDADQRVVGPSLLNWDRRALPIVDDLVSSIGHRSLHSTTGHWAAPEFGLPKLAWIQRTYPGAWQQVRTILQLHDWFIFSLCGAIASEASSAAMSQMMDTRAGTWAYELLAAECGVRAEMMPQFGAAGTRAGGLLRSVAERAGLPAGLPVHLGGGDTHMSALAAGGRALGCPVVIAGTTGPAQLAVESAVDLEAWFPLLVSALPGATGWALESNAGPTGEIVDRLNGLNQLSGASLQAALAERGFATDNATDPSGPLTVLAGNPFFGPRGWSVWPAPTVFGLTPGHTGADLLDAARSSTCLAFSQVLNQLSSALEFRADTVVATGGMSRSATWSQTLADVTGRTVLVRELDQLSGLAGAALVAGVCVESALRDLEPARYIPDATRYDDLQRSAENYCRLYSAGQAQSRENYLSRNGVDVNAGPH